MGGALAQLPKLEKAKQLLAECTSVQEAKHFHDVAEAARQYARMNGLGLETQNLATEIKIRAGRRAGELLEKSERKRRGGRQSSEHSTLPHLADFGFDKFQSHRFQRLAAVPEGLLEKYIRDTTEAQREITTTAVLRMGKAAKKKTAATPPREEYSCYPSLASITGQKFGTIYADPPWSYTNRATRANVHDEYKATMDVAEILAMPVGNYASDDAHLHLWATKDFLRTAFDVIEAWGFEFKSEFVWVKTQMGIGNYWRMSHEHLLLGVRGDAKRFNEHKHKSWGEFPRGKHSAKPEEIRGIIEAVSPGPYLELFGRAEVPGWVSVGNDFDEQRRLA